MELIETRDERAHRILDGDVPGAQISLNEPEVPDLSGRHARHGSPAGECGSAASTLSQPIEG